MRSSRTLSRAVRREVATYAAVGCAVFLLILLVQNLGQQLDELIEAGFAGRDAGAVVRWMFPMVAGYAVPVGFLFGVLTTMGRIAADSELVAARACGLGLAALLRPVLGMALLTTALTGWLMIDVEPRARLALRAVLHDVAARGAVLEPGRFRSLADNVVYVRSRTRENELQGIMISDRTEPERPFLIFAERGRFALDAEEMVIHLELENGDLHLERTDGEREAHRRIAFERFDYALDASAMLDPARRMRPREMSLTELARRIEAAEDGAASRRDPNDYRVAYHRRLALPFAPLVFAALGVPLGLRSTQGARSRGVLVCVGLVSAYYLLLTFGRFAGEAGTIAPWLGLWLPNAAFGACAIPLLWRARQADA